MDKNRTAGRTDIEATRPRGFARRTPWMAVALCGALGLLAGCDRAQEKSAGEKLDSAIARTEKAAREARATTEQAAADAKAKIDEKAPAAGAAVERGVADTKAAAKEAGAAIGAAVDDASITARVSAGLAKDPDLSALRIDVDTRGGAVTLKGPAPSEAAKERAGRIAREVQGVSSVDNALEVKAM